MRGGRDRWKTIPAAQATCARERALGFSLIGLAAAEPLERRPENAVLIAAAAGIDAKQQGLVLHPHQLSRCWPTLISA
jgi:hypothetical protein